MNSSNLLILSYKECNDLIAVWNALLRQMESEQDDPDLMDAYDKMKPIMGQVFELKNKMEI